MYGEVCVPDGCRECSGGGGGKDRRWVSALREFGILEAGAEKAFFVRLNIFGNRPVVHVAREF